MVYLLVAIAVPLIALTLYTLLARRAILTLEDAIAVPGGTAELRAWVERKLFLFVDPNVEGATVEFHGEAGLLGTAKTDLDGIARWVVREFPPGLHRIRARLAPGSPHHASEAEAWLGVFHPEDPAIITDIDHTVADVSPFGFITKPNSSVRPIPGAPEALREMSAWMHIVYLSARDHIFVGKTRAWLRANGFPEGLLLLRRLRFTEASPLEHKLLRLQDVVARLKNIRFGVGDLPTDVEAYRARGVPAILLSERVVPGLDAQRAASWNEILEIARRDRK